MTIRPFSREAAVTDLAAGLQPEHRFRCTGCGNVTRFDVVSTTRARTYQHFDLGGGREVEEEEVLSLVVESVQCRWCERTDAIVVESAPVAQD
jgi:hypothetical protein